MSRIPFTRIVTSGREIEYVTRAIANGELAGDGSFGRACERWLETRTGCARALLTGSGTAALEMAAILADVKAGDEVIMPSFTFSSTANAFVLRGATPVFVDIRADMFTIDVDAAAAAVTPKTRAIVPVHYAGVACDMGRITELASRNGIVVIEDAAQALLAGWEDRALGTIGATGALSFHQTKNVAAGEAGALLVNNPDQVMRAEIIREKGTNRSEFRRGTIDKYTWVDAGSSYVAGELVAAFLLAQLERAEEITADRQRVWDLYHAALDPLERAGVLTRPKQRANAHLYAILLPSAAARARVIAALEARGISAVFHYIPLHSSPAGLRYGRVSGSLPITDDVSARLLRLPIWPGLTTESVDEVVRTIGAYSLSSCAIPSPVRP
jgi:dTDP-4-amino-4,6-dideoxygalactose transaminase